MKISSPSLCTDCHIREQRKYSYCHSKAQVPSLEGICVHHCTTNADAQVTSLKFMTSEYSTSILLMSIFCPWPVTP